MMLVDTSVWIEVFRKPSRIVIDEVADVDDIVTALPIVQEVLQGFENERAFAIARDAMLAFPVVESPLTADVFLQAADVYRSARRAGVTIRSSTDCLIAVCASRHHLMVAHVDRDYEHLSRVIPLQTRRLALR